MDDEIFGGKNNENQPEDEVISEQNKTAQNEAETEEVLDFAEEPANDSNNTQQNQNNGFSQQPFGGYNTGFGGQQSYNAQPPYGNGQTPFNNNGQYSNPYGYAPYGTNPPQQGKPKKSNSGMKVFIAIIAVIVVLAAALMIAIFSGSADMNNPVIENSTSSEKIDAGNVGDLQVSDSSLEAGEAAVVAEIAQKYNVGILIYKSNSLYTEGSGVVVKEDEAGKYTYIITCAHVVNYQGVAVSVLMPDGTEYSADVVGLDTRTDIAVVRIEASGLVKAEFADSDKLVVGQTVYAVGNPGGSEFFGSVSNGIISAIDRPVSSNTGYEMECIQHTAAINPGNSGGALVNGEGKIVGINSMKIASTEYEGMGFAVPSDVVIEVFNSIIENGYVAGRAKLGISYTTPSMYSQTYSMYVQMKGLPSGTIVIAEIASDSDLATKDIQVGDMITKVNGRDMTDSGMLSAMIEDMSAGDTLTLTIVRVNTENWTQTEFNVTVSLVEDRGGAAQSTEDDNSSSQQSQDPFGGNYNDWYEYYKDYFGY